MRMSSKGSSAYAHTCKTHLAVIAETLDKMLRLYANVLDLFVLACFFWWGCASSRSGSAGYCTEAPIEISSSNLNVILGVSGGPGTVCCVCVIGGEVAADATFTVNNLWPGTSSNWTVVNGTLIVFDTESVFLHDTFTSVRCFRDDPGNPLVIFVTITIYKPPVIEGEPYVSEGSDLVLDCDSTNSRPPAAVTSQWLSPSGKVLSKKGIFRIMNITRDMAGVYTCVAYHNDITGTMNTTVTVIVQYPPTVVAEQVNVSIPLGGTLELSCSHVADPPPDTVILWSNNHTHLGASDSRITIDSNDTTTTLRLLDVRRNDSGIYLCNATNDLGWSVALTEVFVHFIVVTGPAEDEIIEAGMLVSLGCKLSGFTGTTLYSWTREGNSLPRNSFQDNNGMLFIPAVQENDSGTYICSAQGAVGNITLTILDTNTAGGHTIINNWQYILVGGLSVCMVIIVLVALLVVLQVKRCLSKKDVEQKELFCNMDSNVAYATPRDVLSFGRGTQ